MTSLCRGGNITDALGDVVGVGDGNLRGPQRTYPANFVHLALHDLTRQPVGVVAVGVIKSRLRRMAVTDVHSIRAGDNPLGAG